ncbi:MAG: RDD family protein [Micrococcales bacterium]
MAKTLNRIGLPVSGPGSLATMPRRVLAIFIDWGCASLLSYAFFQYDNVATLLIFVATQYLFVLFFNASLGHLLAGLRVIRLDRPAPVGAWKSLIRVVLLALVIPVAVWDADGRGLHDKIAGTALIRR